MLKSTSAEDERLGAILMQWWDGNGAARVLAREHDAVLLERATVPLARMFADLQPAAATHGGLLLRALHTARSLLAEPRDETVLHGDLHHENVLDFGERGWLAIDPKFIVGERAFDFANIFTNPDLADPSHPVATHPERFARRLELVSTYAGIERTRLLRWILAWTGLSAAWFLGDGDPLARIDLTIAELAAADLDR